MAMIVHDSSGQIYNESESNQIFSSNICHLKEWNWKKMRGAVHILVYCPIDTLQWGWTHSAVAVGSNRVGRTISNCKGGQCY